MSTGQAGRTCLLNSGLPERGVWCESTAFRHSICRRRREKSHSVFMANWRVRDSSPRLLRLTTACSSKRTVRLISGIALDECRVRERYPARRPFLFAPPEITKSAKSFLLCSLRSFAANKFRSRSHSRPAPDF